MNIIIHYIFFKLPLIFFILLLASCHNSSVADAENSLNVYCHNNKYDEQKLRCDMARAQRNKNLEEIENIVEAYASLLGSRAGIPEAPDKFHHVYKSSFKLTAAQVRTAFTPYARRIKGQAWWLSYPHPTQIDVPLRSLASIITGVLAARRAGAEYPHDLLQIAESAADYLLWAQEQGGKGLFPFPDARGKNERLGQITEKFLALVEDKGKLSEVLVNGWIVEDFGDGGLQFDNGVCGVAMLELYEATGQKKYLRSALAAADWAVLQPVVPNWNYNSFSVFLLSHAYRVTGDQRYLESAKEKARLGIYPGQIKTGLHQGSWVDPHNARLVYRYIIVRGLGALVAVLPENDPDLPEAVDTLSMALRVANAEIIEHGISSPDYLLEVLSRLQLTLPASSSPLTNEGRAEALDLVGHYASSRFLKGELPVGPAAWGLFLETLNNQEENDFILNN